MDSVLRDVEIRCQNAINVYGCTYSTVRTEYIRLKMTFVQVGAR